MGSVPNTVCHSSSVCLVGVEFCFLRLSYFLLFLLFFSFVYLSYCTLSEFIVFYFFKTACFHYLFEIVDLLEALPFFFFFFFVPSLHGLLVCVCLAGRGFLRASHSLGKHSEDALAHTRVIRVVQKYILIFSSFSPQFAVIFIYIYRQASTYLPTFIYIIHHL